MTRVDVHQHVWPDAFRRALERRSLPPRLRGGTLELPHGGAFEVDAASYAPEARLADLDRWGLDVALVSLPPTMEPTRDLVEAWTNAADALARETRQRLLPLGYEESRQDLVGAIVGATALVDLDTAAPLLDALEREGRFLFVHPAATPPGSQAWWAPGVSYPAQLLRAYAAWIAEGTRRWPRLDVVFALLAGGAAFQLERLVRRGLPPGAALPPTVWLETSSYGERSLDLSLRTFGASCHVFGSDAPIDAGGEARAVAGRFGDDLEHALLGANPAALLDRSREPWAA